MIRFVFSIAIATLLLSAGWKEELLLGRWYYVRNTDRYSLMDETGILIFRNDHTFLFAECDSSFAGCDTAQGKYALRNDSLFLEVKEEKELQGFRIFKLDPGKLVITYNAFLSEVVDTVYFERRK